MPTNVWPTWSSTTTNGIDVSTVWKDWNVQFYTGTATSYTSSNLTSATWNDWANSWTLQVSNGTHKYTQPAPPPPLTAEQQAAQAEAQRVAKLASEERERNRKAAHDVAMAFLRLNLDEAQLAELDAHKWFQVVAASGKLYRIKCDGGDAGNVRRVEADKEVERLCIHASWAEGVPMPDSWLSQKLLLETDEEAFRRIANISRL